MAAVWLPGGDGAMNDHPPATLQEPKCFQRRKRGAGEESILPGRLQAF